MNTNDNRGTITALNVFRRALAYSISETSSVREVIGVEDHIVTQGALWGENFVEMSFSVEI